MVENVPAVELDDERPKPHLARFLEAVAAILELDSGRQRLELTFEAGRLVEWSTHAERSAATELARFDERSAWLVSRTAAA